MFCPSCGAEDRQSSQFCRACGVDLRAIYVALQKPESVLVSGRDEVYRAIAARIRDKKEDLSEIVEEVLPNFEKMIEGPEERRLRQIRSGVLYVAAGTGLAIYLILRQLVLVEGSLALLGAFVAFLVGVAYIINGWVFSLPGRDWSVNFEEENSAKTLNQTLNDRLPESVTISGPVYAPPSPTESTTRNLVEEQKPDTSPMQ